MEQWVIQSCNHYILFLKVLSTHSTLQPLLRRISLELAENALQAQDEITIFCVFFKGTDKIFFKAVVFDCLARVQYQLRGLF
jgi:hypothetical protein